MWNVIGGVGGVSGGGGGSAFGSWIAWSTCIDMICVHTAVASRKVMHTDRRSMNGTRFRSKFIDLPRPPPVSTLTPTDHLESEEGEEGCPLGLASGLLVE